MRGVTLLENVVGGCLDEAVTRELLLPNISWKVILENFCADILTNAATALMSSGIVSREDLLFPPSRGALGIGTKAFSILNQGKPLPERGIGSKAAFFMSVNPDMGAKAIAPFKGHIIVLSEDGKREERDLTFGGLGSPSGEGKKLASEVTRMLG